MNDIVKRLKSPVVWSAVLAQIVLIVSVVNPNVATEVKIIGGAILEIFTVIGLLNNPTDRGGF